jgi:outer membrane protein TolC
MNLSTSLLALALLGMDDPHSKPDSPPKGSVEAKAHAEADHEPVAADRIRKSAQDLKQIEQAVIFGSPPPKSLMKPRTTNDAEAQEVWPMTLQQAIRIGLDNSEIVRVVAFGSQGIPIGGFPPTPSNHENCAQASPAAPAPIVIARLNADASPYRFQSEVMAHVRSVEQDYWALAQAHVQLWATDRAVSLTSEILKREQAELAQGRGTTADVAEAAQRLEQFNLELVTRASDIITTERQLRDILGLPPADNRRIIPVTPATGAKVEPVWDTCVSEMLEQAPEIVQRKTALRKLRDAVAIASANVHVGPTTAASDRQKPDATNDNPSVKSQWSADFMAPLPGPDAAKDDPETRQRIIQQETELQQAIRQQAHSLARFFLEIDANCKQLQTAKRLRAAAADRLDSQRAYYEEGRITIDRFLDAVSQYATAVGTEAQYRAAFNTWIVGLKEAKGTLLADYQIVVAEPKPRKAIAASQPKPDAAVKPSALTALDKSEPVPAPLHERIGLGPMPRPASECREATKAASLAGPTPATKTWTFSLTIGSGPSPDQIKGTISADDRIKASP